MITAFLLLALAATAMAYYDLGPKEGTWAAQWWTDEDGHQHYWRYWPQWQLAAVNNQNGHRIALYVTRRCSDHDCKLAFKLANEGNSDVKSAVARFGVQIPDHSEVKFEAKTGGLTNIVDQNNKKKEKRTLVLLDEFLPAGTHNIFSFHINNVKNGDDVEPAGPHDVFFTVDP